MNYRQLESMLDYKENQMDLQIHYGGALQAFSMACLSDQFTQAELEEFFGDPDNQGLVVTDPENDHSLVGFVLYRVKPHCFDVAGIASRDVRATALMLDTLAGKLSGKRVRVLLDVSEYETPTHLLLKKLGWEPIDVDRGEATYRFAGYAPVPLEAVTVETPWFPAIA